MDAVRVTSLTAAMIATGLVAGLFYAFACSVMPGLSGTDDRTFVDVMQRINVAILNGWFAIGFGGALVLPALAAVLHLGRPALPWIVAALVGYGVALAVTFGVNVPLNDALATAGPGADLAAVRGLFEARWVRWNIVRAVACTVALGLLGWALVVEGRVPPVAPSPA